MAFNVDDHRYLLTRYAMSSHENEDVRNEDTFKPTSTYQSFQRHLKGETDTSNPYLKKLRGKADRRDRKLGGEAVERREQEKDQFMKQYSIMTQETK
ncbi:hypothetical protein H100_07791 [Trichophyton rubrum MR850]|nr:hypothetical protein H100_07791 [Trichophyton rubrum MR850]KMQ41185.1 hypothetical protein HL42_8109 [Trichophyton rubrum]